jgi:hypothetical protein
MHEFVTFEKNPAYWTKGLRWASDNPGKDAVDRK